MNTDGWAPGAGHERGSAIIELPLVLGLILLPFGLLVLILPTWVERQTAARDAAAEAARHLVVGGDPGDVASLVREIEAGYDLAPGTLRIESDPTLVPGSSTTVRVTVELPVAAVPMLGAVGRGSWTAEHTEHVPDHGDLGP